MKRIADLTIQLARATNRELELQLKTLREALAQKSEELYGTSKSERRDSEKKKKKKPKDKQTGHGPTEQPKLPWDCQPALAPPWQG